VDVKTAAGQSLSSGVDNMVPVGTYIIHRRRRVRRDIVDRNMILWRLLFVHMRTFIRLIILLSISGRR